MVASNTSTSIVGIAISPVVWYDVERANSELRRVSTPTGTPVGAMGTLSWLRCQQASYAKRTPSGLARVRTIRSNDRTIVREGRQGSGRGRNIDDTRCRQCIVRTNCFAILNARNRRRLPVSRRIDRTTIRESCTGNASAVLEQQNRFVGVKLLHGIGNFLLET
jgi:hypothetical protein